MSTFTCSQLSSAFGWGACSCNGNPMPTIGSVSSPNFPYSTYGWTQANKTFAKNDCCEIACDAYALANPLSLLQGPMGESGQLTGVDKLDKRTIARNAMRSASGDIDESKLTDADREALAQRPDGPTKKIATINTLKTLGVVAVIGGIAYLLIRKKK